MRDGSERLSLISLRIYRSRSSPIPGTEMLRRFSGDFDKALQFSEVMNREGLEGELALYFPIGYWHVGETWSIRLSIIGALYRWNWKLRRRKGLPLSAADIAYAKAVPEILCSVRDCHNIPEPAWSQKASTSREGRLNLIRGYVEETSISLLERGLWIRAYE